MKATSLQGMEAAISVNLCVLVFSVRLSQLLWVVLCWFLLSLKLSLSSLYSIPPVRTHWLKSGSLHSIPPVRIHYLIHLASCIASWLWEHANSCQSCIKDWQQTPCWAHCLGSFIPNGLSSLLGQILMLALPVHSVSPGQLHTWQLRPIIRCCLFFNCAKWLDYPYLVEVNILLRFSVFSLLLWNTKGCVLCKAKR